MKKLFWTIIGVASAAVLVSTGMARAEMVKGEVTKISGEMVDIKDADGKVRTIHNDVTGTKRTGDLKVGAVVEADVTGSGHANTIMVQMKKESKKDMKKDTQKETKKDKKEIKK